MSEDSVSHRVIVHIAQSQFRKLLEEGRTFRVIRGLPPQSSFIVAQFDGCKGIWHLVFEHPEFPSTKEGERYPELEMEVERIYSALDKGTECKTP